MIKLLLFTLLASNTSFSADIGNYRSNFIRVAIVTNADSLSLNTSGKIYVYEQKSNKRYMLLANSKYAISAIRGNTIRIAGQSLRSPVKIVAPDGEERIKISDHVYKGEIILHSTEDEKLNIVENIPLEDYISGVLVFEMSPLWPIEALKAQAVASRTFALKNLRPNEPFDITSGVERQVYNGIHKVNSRIMKAVNATKGEVLTYKGGLFKTYFHACCGGHTENNHSAWNETAVKPLKGVKDPYCRNSKNFKWNLYISKKELLAFAQKMGSTALRIRSMKIFKKSRSQRTVALKLFTDKKSFVIKTYDLRKYMGATDFRSTFITKISSRKGGFKIYGRGWGHGVGMCQEGAKRIANKGKNYKRILRHYYPYSRLSNIATLELKI